MNAKIPLRERLRARGTLKATFSIIPSPQVLEIIAIAGFDVVIIDMEHGPISLGELPSLVAAVQGAGAYPVVRVPECADHVIGAVLDIGAAGVLVPQVQTAAQAERAVAAARYAPAGHRGVNPWTRAARYGATANWTERSNLETAILVMIEGAEGVANVDAIMAVRELDGIFLGPVDLAHSLGFPGQPEHPTVVGTIESIAAKALQSGVVVAAFAPNAAGARRLINRGVGFVAVSEDTATIRETFAALSAQIGGAE